MRVLQNEKFIAKKIKVTGQPERKAPPMRDFGNRVRKSSSERDRAKAIAPLVRRVTKSLIGGAFLSGWPVTNKKNELSTLGYQHRLFLG